MTIKRLLFGLVLALVFFGQALQAQQSNADGKQLTDLRVQAEKGDAKAQNQLGVVFSEGRLGVAKDKAEAVKWFRKASEQNNAAAQYNLGQSYFAGDGVAKDKVEAVKWYRKAAEQNYAWAQHQLGFCYQTGSGVAKDEAESLKWYRKAAEQWRKAADQKDAIGQFQLGVCYSKGLGVVEDEAEAVNWWRKAAEQNHDTSQYNLSVCYQRGQGVAKDMAEAYKWFLLAAAQGHESARKYMAKLEGMMSPEEMAEGKRRANDWLEQRKKASAGKSSQP
jgi:TPR repeat protein